MSSPTSRLASRTAVEIDFECELLTGTWRCCRQESPVIPALKWLFHLLMELREPLDRGQVALFGQERADQVFACREVPRWGPIAHADRGNTLFDKRHHSPLWVGWKSDR